MKRESVTVTDSSNTVHTSKLVKYVKCVTGAVGREHGKLVGLSHQIFQNNLGSLRGPVASTGSFVLNGSAIIQAAPRGSSLSQSCGTSE
jgi:hypothetical protein